MTTNRWVRAWLVTCVLGALLPAAGLAQPLPGPASSWPAPSTAAEPAPAIAPAPDPLYSAMAVVGTGLGFPAREILCGVGEVVGFFALAVFRLPVWALTLGDRFGSSEPLDRFGTSIIETACEGPSAISGQHPWVITGPQAKELARPLEGTVMGGARATVATRATEAEGP